MQHRFSSFCRTRLDARPIGESPLSPDGDTPYGNCEIASCARACACVSSVFQMLVPWSHHTTTTTSKYVTVKHHRHYLLLPSTCLSTLPRPTSTELPDRRRRRRRNYFSDPTSLLKSSAMFDIPIESSPEHTPPPAKVAETSTTAPESLSTTLTSRPREPGSPAGDTTSNLPSLLHFAPSQSESSQRLRRVRRRLVVCFPSESTSGLVNVGPVGYLESQRARCIGQPKPASGHRPGYRLDSHYYGHVG